MYERKSAKKEKIQESTLWEHDLKSFHGHIGFITNVSTTYFSLLPLFEKDSDEWNAIVNRIKLCCCWQSMEIDKTKGIVVKDFPAYWTKWTHIKDIMEDKEKVLAEFNNSILAEKRPYFMKYLYPHYNKDFLNFLDRYETISVGKFGFGIKELLEKKVKNEEEEDVITVFEKYSPLLDSDCTLNNISHFLEEKLREVRSTANQQIDFDFENFLDREVGIDSKKLRDVEDLYWDYLESKRDFKSGNLDSEMKFKTIEQFNKYVKQKALRISSNICELANLSVYLCYKQKPSYDKSFVWNIFGEGLICNLQRNSKNGGLPIIDENGGIEYLGKRYSWQRLDDYI